MNRVIALAVVVTLSATTPAGLASTNEATVVGHVLLTESESPLSGARIRLIGVSNEQRYRSEPTSRDGSFRLADLPPDAYRVSIERDGLLFVVDSPIRLGPGETVDVDLAVRPAVSIAPAASSGRPVLHGLLIAGSAIVAGLVVKEIIDDDEPRQPSPTLPD
jgi:hypothetical protein